MTNSIAAVIALLIAALFVLDATVMHWGLPLILGRMTVQLVEWVSFWR